MSFVFYCAAPQLLDQNLMIEVFYMAKYDYNFKLKVVKSYLNGEGGYITLAKQYGIPAHSQVEQWINAYRWSKKKKYNYFIYRTI